VRSLLLLILVGCPLVDAKIDKPVDPNSSEWAVFEVPKGSNARIIGPLLKEAGLVEDVRYWRAYLKIRGAGGCLKAGRFELSRSQSMPEIMETLCGVPISDAVAFTVVEGWRIQEIDAAISSRGWAEKGAYTQAAGQPASFDLPGNLEGITSLEGLLFPDTYQVEPDRFEVEGFIQRQLDALDTRFVQATGEDLQERGIYPVVIMASLVEREEPLEANMPVVAGVLWKRLDNRWNLGVDATSRYTLEVWNDRRAFLKMLRDSRDPYNTRLRPGLPPTPIGNPGLRALHAALSPKDSGYWYYLHDAKGQIHLSRSSKEHEAFRKRYSVY
jgi:UPF0755 protein